MPTGPRGVNTGLARTCFLVLAIFDRAATAAEVCGFLLSDGVDVSRRQVAQALNQQCREPQPLIERTVQGRGGTGAPCPSWYRLTDHGRAVAAED